MLEAFNKKLDRWELIDPDYNLFYKSKDERIGIKDVVKLSYGMYEPCSEKGCGWSLKHGKDAPTAEFLRNNNYYGIAFSEHIVAYVNEAKLKKNKSVEWVKKHTSSSKVYKF